MPPEMPLEMPPEMRPDAPYSVPSVVIEEAALDRMIHLLSREGRRVIAPVLRDGAIVNDTVDSLADLARGWVEDQDGGHYRLRREGRAFFGHTTGPSPWKRILHPPRQALWSVELQGNAPRIVPEPVDATRYALIGLRSCDLAAILVQDKVFLDGPYRDPHYAARRAGLFIVVVNCGRSAATCFCTSMGTGPRAEHGYDIALTEIGEGGTFVAAPGSDSGAALLSALASRPAVPDDLAAAQAATERAAAGITRHLATKGLPELIQANPDHDRWDTVAARCLNCGNCTMVCPTCFCTSVEEASAIDGTTTARSQRWASCFTVDFSHVHGGAVRHSARSRYRQWMTHKLSTWVNQFDTSGCVGCGRCITWCPVGIDLTEEAAAMAGGSNGC